MGASGSIDPFILVDFGGFEKLLNFRCRFWASKDRSGKLRAAPTGSGRLRPAFRKDRRGPREGDKEGGNLGVKYSKRRTLGGSADFGTKLPKSREK